MIPQILGIGLSPVLVAAPQALRREKGGVVFLGTADAWNAAKLDLARTET